MTSLRRQRWVRDPWTVVVAGLAAYRLTRLVTTDHLPPAVRLREMLADNTPEEYAMLWSCPHCMGFWIAGAVTAAAEVADRCDRRNTFLLAAMPWAISAVVGILSEREAS